MGAVAVLAVIALVLLVRGYTAPTELTEADNGGTFELSVGQRLSVTLPDGGTMGGWTVDRHDRQTVSVTQPSPSSFEFEAIAPGRSEVVVIFRGLAASGPRPGPFHVVVDVR